MYPKKKEESNELSLFHLEYVYKFKKNHCVIIIIFIIVIITKINKLIVGSSLV